MIFLIFMLILPTNCLEHYFSWNSSNSKFKSAREPTVDVRLGDSVRFVCPETEEYLVVYEVGELAFSDCLLESRSREVLRCAPESMADKVGRTHKFISNEFTPKSVVQSIRQLNPIPNGKEYQPGQTYYYITTSTGKLDGLEKNSRGLCESSNMRMALRVLPALPRRFDEITRKTNSGEDEDSEVDGNVLPRDLVSRQDKVNPKFRRPSEFKKAAQSAGVHDRQFMKVVQLAKEGKTGTFENDMKLGSSEKPWDPINVQFVSEILQKTYSNDDALAYEREPDFEIHEENVQSLEYSSSTLSTFTFMSIIWSIFYLL